MVNKADDRVPHVSRLSDPPGCCILSTSSLACLCCCLTCPVSWMCACKARARLRDHLRGANASQTLVPPIQGAAAAHGRRAHRVGRVRGLAQGADSRGAANVPARFPPPNARAHPNAHRNAQAPGLFCVNPCGLGWFTVSLNNRAVTLQQAKARALLAKAPRFVPARARLTDTRVIVR